MVYLNEHDPFAAQWLRNLWPDATVDQRDIQDVQPADVAGFRRCHFFGGIGGWEYALELAGWPADVEVWTGSCPCQDFSVAGKRACFSGERDLWPAWYGLIRECRPNVIFGEQVDNATEWYDRLAYDLEALDYVIGAAVVPACAVGAWHERRRLWFVAYPNSRRLAGSSSRESAQNKERNLASYQSAGNAVVCVACASIESPWPCGPCEFRQIPRMDDGVSTRMEERNAYGNAIVPQVAAEFIRAAMPEVLAKQKGVVKPD